MKQKQRKVLIIVAHFKWQHIDYLSALARHSILEVAIVGEAHQGAVKAFRKTGRTVHSLGQFRQLEPERLEQLLAHCQPDVVHLMYYFHEELTILARRLAPARVKVVYECRDPLTTLMAGDSAAKSRFLEKHALRASDARIFVSEAMRDHLATLHDQDLSEALIIPHGFPASAIAPPSEKLSATDQRMHIALVGTASTIPQHGRNYLRIIRQLVDYDFVVHSHFYLASPQDRQVYESLARQLKDYHCHDTVSFRQDTELSQLISRYDLMGVFHELDAVHKNEANTLAVCMPTKAVCGWLYGGIPVVCFSHYRGLVEQIDTHDIGFTIKELAETQQLLAQWPRIQQSTQRCLAYRQYFTNEHSAERIAAFYEQLI